MGWGKCSAGVCPQPQAGQYPPLVPSHRREYRPTNLPFSNLGVPVAAGMSDCYENMSWTPIRHRLAPLLSSFQRRLESRRGGEGQDHQSMEEATRPTIFISLMRPSQGHVDSGESVPRTPKPGRNPGVEARHKWHPIVSNNRPHSHTLLCRRQPAWPSPMKSCPGPRSGIDSRHSSRHSSEGWNPEGEGRGKTTNRWKKRHVPPFSSPLCGLRKAMLIPAKACPVPRNRAGIHGWRRGTNGTQSFPTTGPILIPCCAGGSRHDQVL